MNFIHYFFSIAVRNDPEQVTFPSGITLKALVFTFFLCFFCPFNVQTAELTSDLPSPDSLTLINQALESKDSRALYPTYRGIPQIKRSVIPDLVLRLFHDASS